MQDENTIEETKDTLIQRSSKDPIMMAMFLLQSNPGIIRCQENLYQFNGKCYDLMSDKDLDEMFLTFCINKGVTGAWKNVSSIIRAFLVYPSITKIEKMNDYPSLLNLNNGVLNIHTKEFIPHSGKADDYYFDSYIKVDYDKDAKTCPDFTGYLNHTFNNDTETITNIIRLGGYLLDTSCAAERMFLFDGNGANGKSVLINTFQLFFSEDQISPLSLDVLSSQSFSKELLIKSRVNFCAEQKKGFLDAEELKKIITGDKMEINRKFKISLTFTPKCKIISASNGLPTFSDRTHAIFRRILIVRFKNQYLNELEYSKVKYPERMRVFKKDKTIFDKIKAERSAILNLFIEGLIDLRANNYEFIESADSVAAMDEFKKDSDTVREFLLDNYEISDTEKTPLRTVYEHYIQWYHRNVQDSGSVKFRINEMGKRIKDIVGVDPIGQEYVFDSETQTSKRETVYPLKLIEFSIPIEEIITPEQVTQRGLEF